MITIRKSKDRGHENHGWLDTYHTFSFGRYYDPNFMGFRVLRVINEDRVEANNGFPPHSHDNMEIISYVLEGSLQHQDSIGTGSVILPGEVQRMSAGTGVTHSEFNPSKNDQVHFFQIWIIPKKRGIEPSYEQKKFEVKDKNNQLCLIASGDGSAGSVTIQQDVKLFTSILQKGKELSYPLTSRRYGWIQIARGKISLNGQILSEGDGASISNENDLKIMAEENSEFFLFDLP